MPSLRIRKNIYFTLALASSLVWFPLALFGIAILIGIPALLCLGALLRCIRALPVRQRFSRIYYSVAITIGILLLGGFLAIITTEAALGMDSFSVLGPPAAVLIVVAIAVLIEMHWPGLQQARLNRNVEAP
jgi:hypothetical protein